MSEILDRAGKAWRLTYGGSTCAPPAGVSGSAVCLADPEGATSIWTSSPEFNLVHHRDAGDVDEAGNPRRNDRQYGWSANRLRREVEEAGNLREYDWNENGQLAEARFTGVGEATVTTRLSYQAVSPGVADLVSARLAAGTPEERVWSFARASDGSLAGVTDPRARPPPSPTTSGACSRRSPTPTPSPPPTGTPRWPTAATTPRASPPGSPTPPGRRGRSPTTFWGGWSR